MAALILVTPSSTDLRVLAGYLIFLASYIVFACGKFPGMKIDRAGMAVIGAVLMVVSHAVRPNDVQRHIDFATIVLLFSMMMVVGSLRWSGFFDAIAGVVVRRLGAQHLLPAVILTTGVLSAFFVNDIICLVMVPIVLKITKRMKLQPLSYLLAVATASNIGSVGTITGNPQNILIGASSGIPYRQFLWHLGPVALVGLVIDWAVLHWLFPHQSIEKEASLGEEAGGKMRFGKPIVVVVGLLAGFLLGFPPALVAAVAAAVVLISRTTLSQRIYAEVDWGLLVFFVGLFVIVGGAEEVGLTRAMFGLFQSWNLHNPAAFTVAVTVLSNFVSNVPAVMLLKSMIPGFANPPKAWLLLAMASTLAGNLTITGSIANIIVVEQAKSEVEIRFRDYVRVGIPVTLLTLVFGTLWVWFI